jgi:iron complex transport system permease protein
MTVTPTTATPTATPAPPAKRPNVPQRLDDPAPMPGRRRGWAPGGVLLICLAMGLCVAIVAGGAIGAYAITPAEVLGSLAHRIGLSLGPLPQGMGEAVLWEIRFPRVALAVLVGASLACAGAAMQGSFSNPLAEPGVVGVSSGAMLGAVAQIVLGFSFAGIWTITVMAFLGGLVTVMAVYAASRSEGRTEVVTLVLTGIAVNAMAGAGVGLLSYFSTDAQLRSITFWTLGSMAQANWPKVFAVLPVALIGLVLANLYARQLDLLALGERPARHLGVDVERLRISMMVTVAILTASAVAVSGMIMFVGLVIPHLIRMIAGPGHRLLLPAASLAGATILVVGDLIARTVAAPAEIPLGVLTALIGSPFFFWMLRRTRARQGGWA